MAKKGDLFSSFRFRELKNNSRFYILILSFLVSLLVLAYLRVVLQNDQLYIIRVEQVYGFLALLFWYFALLATPLSKIFGKEGFMKQYLYARRALGVSAACFALLHAAVSLFGQLGGVEGVGLLPQRFQQALIYGFVALVFLLLMAITSFDRVVDWLTFPRWKWLHRMGYIAAILVFAHVWMIGTHLAYPWVKWALFGVLAVLAAAESWRITLSIEKKSGGSSPTARYFLAICMFVLLAGLIAFAPRLVSPYHAAHESSNAESGNQ